MNSLFWVSYGLLWLATIGQGLLVFLLLRELGKVYLSQTSAYNRDGMPIGKRVPDLLLETPAGMMSLSELTDGSPYSAILLARSDCDLCDDAATVVRRWVSDSTKLRGVVLVEGDDLGGYDDRGRSKVARLESGDLQRRLKVRGTPFLLFVNRELVVLSKGIVNTDAHMASLIERAGTEAAADFADKLNTRESMAPQVQAQDVAVAEGRLEPPHGSSRG
jgi:hypothetical protein